MHNHGLLLTFYSTIDQSCTIQNYYVAIPIKKCDFKNNMVLHDCQSANCEPILAPSRMCRKYLILQSQPTLILVPPRCTDLKTEDTIDKVFIKTIFSQDICNKIYIFVKKYSCAQRASTQLLIYFYLFTKKGKMKIRCFEIFLQFHVMIIDVEG